MKVGIYLNTDHLADWSWQDFRSGRLAVSGTDALSLFLADRLGDASLQVAFFVTNPGRDAQGLQQWRVASLSQAVKEARRLSLGLLVFNNTGRDESEDGVMACASLHQPCVVVDHNGPWCGMADRLEGAPCVLRLVCVSAAQTNAFRDHPVFGKTEVIANPLRAYAVRSPIDRDPRSVAFLGSLTPSKGFHHLAAAWPEIRSAMPNAVLNVIGSARLYDRRQRLGPLGVAEMAYETGAICPHLGETLADAEAQGVRFMGLMQPTDIQEQLRRVSVCVVNPNCRGSIETFCVSAIEASASGAAVVGARQGGLRETVIEGRTGLLIRRERDLAGAVIRLLRHPEFAAELGECGSRYVSERFAPERIIMEWRRLLQRASDGQRAMPPRFRHDGTLRLLARESIRIARRVPGLGGLPPARRMWEAVTRPF